MELFLLAVFYTYIILLFCSWPISLRCMLTLPPFLHKLFGKTELCHQVVIVITFLTCVYFPVSCSFLTPQPSVIFSLQTAVLWIHRFLVIVYHQARGHVISLHVHVFVYMCICVSCVLWYVVDAVWILYLL